MHIKDNAKKQKKLTNRTSLGDSASEETSEKLTGGVLESAKAISVKHNWSNNSNTKKQQHNVSGGHHLYSKSPSHNLA